MDGIVASVGNRGANRRVDVAWVQTALLRHARWIGQASAVIASGRFDPGTARAVIDFQARGAALAHPTGLLSPTDFAVRQLARAVIPWPRSSAFAPVCWRRSDAALSHADYAAAAAVLGCETAAVQAVAQTETKKSAWDDNGRPTILYERHYFSRLTHRVFDRTHPDISNRHAYGRSGHHVSPDNTYGRSRQQYDRLFRAAVLDEGAALQSASWGAFQIMGSHYEDCGFPGVAEFVEAMITGEKQHLDAFVALIKSNRRMRTALQTRDWTGFALAYNGSDKDGNVVDGYDDRIAAAYGALQSGNPRAGAVAR